MFGKMIRSIGGYKDDRNPALAERRGKAESVGSAKPFAELGRVDPLPVEQAAHRFGARSRADDLVTGLAEYGGIAIGDNPLVFGDEYALRLTHAMP